MSEFPKRVRCVIPVTIATDVREVRVLKKGNDYFATAYDPAFNVWTVDGYTYPVACFAELAEEPAKTEFVKHDALKPPMDLVTRIPLEPLMEVARVVEYGAKKYSQDNWKKGTTTRYLAAALRHVWAYAGGETHDKESDHHHLAHAASSLLFIMAIEEAKEKAPSNE